MLTEKENFLMQLRGETPERLTNQYGPLVCIMMEPISGYLMGSHSQGESKDPFGVSFLTRADEPGRMPQTDEAHKVIKDITQWRDYVTMPDLKANCSDPAGWEAARKQADAVRGPASVPGIRSRRRVHPQHHPGRTHGHHPAGNL